MHLGMYISGKGKSTYIYIYSVSIKQFIWEHISETKESLLRGKSILLRGGGAY